MKKLKIALLRYFHLRNFLTWDSWSGFGVNTNWPDTDWEKDVKTIKRIFECHLPKDWMVYGPCCTVDGAFVMYAWPKDDLNAREMFANQDAPIPTSDELIEQIREIALCVEEEMNR